MVVALGTVAWLVLASPMLALDRVVVVGAARLSAAEVAAAADAPIGRPLIRIDTEAVEARVAARLRPVATVRVARSWPGTLRVVVTERQPAGVLVAGRSFTLVDRDGVAFATVAKRPPGLPVVRADARAGPGRERAVAAALDVLAALPRDLVRQVSTVHAASAESVTLRMRGGVTVVWGASADHQLKATVLQALLPQRAKVYDLSAPEAPVLRDTTPPPSPRS